MTCDATAAAAPHSHPHSFSKRAGSRANISGRRNRGRLCRPGRTCHQKNSGGWGGSRGEGGVGGCMGMQASTNSSPPWSLYPLAMDSYYVAPPSDMLIPSSTGALPPLPTLLPPRSRPARPLGAYISIPTTTPPPKPLGLPTCPPCKRGVAAHATSISLLGSPATLGLAQYSSNTSCSDADSRKPLIHSGSWKRAMPGGAAAAAVAELLLLPGPAELAVASPARKQTRVRQHMLHEFVPWQISEQRQVCRLEGVVKQPHQCLHHAPFQHVSDLLCPLLPPIVTTRLHVDAVTACIRHPVSDDMIQTNPPPHTHTHTNMHAGLLAVSGDVPKAGHACRPEGVRPLLHLCLHPTPLRTCCACCCFYCDHSPAG